MSSAVIVSVQSFPSTTIYLENNSTTKSQARETTNPNMQFTQQPEAMLETQTEPEDKSPTIEFVFKGPIESLTIQKGTNREKYTVLSPKKDEAEKLKSSVPGTENITKTAQWNELNTATTSNNENFPSEIYIKRDKWLLNPQEESSIQGGLPKYFYDTAKSIHPFPELYDESTRNEATHLKKENSVNFHVPLTEEKTNQPPQTAGPALFPRSIYVREFDLPFYD
ncbi:GOLD domain-containing protein [Trichonephila inaurata madagascariensis]|uniref:GOLD domain-containing protein n=1 Tax=Trichonephila inaurata madagascariensis TaxID=2747483 RepID=A0A8X6XTU2_9ARAC|nr:GOLD domain-containing protein [Trichonephila inaurata madagascariensis]